MTYTVRRGDTPASIAAQLGVAWPDVVNLNNSLRINPNFVYAGQVLQLPATRPRYVNPPLEPATRPRYVNPPNGGDQTADALTLAALEAARKKKEQEQLYLYGGIALIAFVVLSRR